MASVNKVILIGNLGRDPEVRTMQQGSKVANLSLATTERWKDKNTGEKRERTEWHRVVVFGAAAGFCESYARKGNTLYVEGKLQTRKWTDQSGAERYTTEVTVQPYAGTVSIVKDDRPAGGGRSSGTSAGDYRSASGGGQDTAPRDPAPAYDDLDDEIPF